MGGRFFIPMSTMLAGLVLWLAFFVWRLVAGKANAWSPSVTVGICVVAGALIVLSGYT